MKRKDNILNIWWFSFLITPIMNIGVFFIPWGPGEKTIFAYMLLFICALSIELYITFKNKVEYKTLQYSFIAFSFILSLFITFGINKFSPEFTKYNLLNNFIYALISIAVLIVIKYAIWFWLLIVQHKLKRTKDASEKFEFTSEKLKQQRDELLSENEKLNSEINKLKSLLAKQEEN